MVLGEPANLLFQVANSRRSCAHEAFEQSRTLARARLRCRLPNCPKWADRMTSGEAAAITGLGPGLHDSEALERLRSDGNFSGICCSGSRSLPPATIRFSSLSQASQRTRKAAQAITAGMIVGQRAGLMRSQTPRRIPGVCGTAFRLRYPLTSSSLHSIMRI